MSKNEKNTQIVCGNGNIMIGGNMRGQTIVSGNGIVMVNGRVVSGGSGTVGNGQVKEEHRVIDRAPCQVVLDLPADLLIQCGASETTVTIITEENLLPLIKANITDECLTLTASESFSTSRPIRIRLQLPTLTSFSLKGSGDTTIGDVDNDSLTLALVGSGDIEVQGKTRRLRVKLIGSGDVDAEGLVAQDAVLDLQGSGDIHARATHSVEATLLGSGDIKVSGSPAKVDKTCMGSGKIKVR